jgi:hypothetical protein
MCVCEAPRRDDLGIGDASLRRHRHPLPPRKFDLLRGGCGHGVQQLTAGAEVELSPDLPDWFCAHFGTYILDEKKGVWITHVLGSNTRSYVGTNQARPFTLRGDRLVISDSYLAGGKRVKAERILIRDKVIR